MSKKSKKAKAKYKSQTKLAVTHIESGTRQTLYKPSTSSPTPVISQSLNEQYKYIIPELVRICIISGVFLVILIILSFIIK